MAQQINKLLPALACLWAAMGGKQYLFRAGNRY